MKRIIAIGIVVSCCFVLNTAYATPITYIANGVASYEATIIDANGISQSFYQETALWGYVTFEDQVESHRSAGEWYYSYSITEFHIATGVEEWMGDSSRLTWESGYGNDEVAFRDVWMSDFISPNSSNFYFLEDGASIYSLTDVSEWLVLPSEIQIWSDSVLGSDAAYVSFSLQAPPLPIPEPSTTVLFAAGLIGLLGRFSHENNKAPEESDASSF